MTLAVPWRLSLRQHLDFVGTFDDMVVGQHITGGADDNAAAQAALGLFALVPVEKSEPRVFGRLALAHGLAGADADYCRRRLLRSVPEAT